MHDECDLLLDKANSPWFSSQEKDKFLNRAQHEFAETRYKFFEKVWSIAVVSISAQIGTFPITVYYFHQFPLYFLLTNLVVVVLAGFILYSGVLFYLSISLGVLQIFFSKTLVPLTLAHGLADYA